MKERRTLRARLQASMFLGNVSVPGALSTHAPSFLPLRLVPLLPFSVSTCHCPLHIHVSASLLLPKQFEKVLLYSFFILLC